jgi:uroporphyrinogen decarboxylase
MYQLEEMTSTARITALLEGKKIDRVPFFPFSLGFSALNIGYRVADVYSDPRKSYAAQLHTQRMYGYDQDPFLGYAAYGTYEFGGETNFPTGDIIHAPASVRFPVNSEKDVGTLQLPDPEKAGMLPRALQFSKLQQQNGTGVSVVLTGVFTLAVNLCGVENLCMWLVNEPDTAHKLLATSADHIMDVVSLWADSFGADGLLVQLWEPAAANSVISPRHFERFVLPHQKRLHEKILALGVKHILCHICGEQNRNLPYWSQVPMGNPGIVSIGNQVGIKSAVKYFGDSCVIAGNLATELVGGGSAQEIYDTAKSCIEEGRKAPRGFILMTACESPPLTPPYNFFMISKAVRDWGRMD